MQIHHIVPESEGGPGDYENGIPVCLDCHAEIESRSNMGRRFTSNELRQHRDRWFQTIRDQPEVLIRSRQTQTETGPLEALLAELDFNRIAVSGNAKEGFPVLAEEQFRRTIATNALGALPDMLREAVQRTYGLVIRVNYHFEEMARMEHAGPAFKYILLDRDKLRAQLVEAIPRVITDLERALGRSAGDPP